jgi:hypothetical protein
LQRQTYTGSAGRFRQIPTPWNKKSPGEPGLRSEWAILGSNQ